MRRAQRLVEIGDDVGRGFQSNREADHVLADSGGGQLCRAHLLMGRARGMDDERLGVADIGQMTRELERLDELAAGGRPPLRPKLTIEPAPRGSRRAANS